MVLLRQSTESRGINLPVCTTCAYIHQTSELVGTPAWLSSSDTSAGSWDGAVGSGVEGGMENIPRSTGSPDDIVTLMEEAVNKS